MKNKSRNNLYRYAFLISLLFGLAVWVLDALFDYLFFYKEHSTFTGLLLTDIPPHEIYIRTCALVLFAGFGLLISYYLKKNTESDIKLTNIFNNVIPICITDNDFNIISANKSYREIFGQTKSTNGPIKCYDSRPGNKCETTDCPHYLVTHENKSQVTCESTKIENDGSQRYFIVTATPYLDIDNNPTGIIETFQDITPRRLLENEREKLIKELQLTMDKVKTLSGFLPICASCKKIRDDKGYWTQIESYIKDHSEAEFSHGICPDCATKLYGNYINKDKDHNKS